MYTHHHLPAGHASGGGGIVASRPGMQLRGCVGRTGFESPYPLGENTKRPRRGVSYAASRQHWQRSLPSAGTPADSLADAAFVTASAAGDAPTFLRHRKSEDQADQARIKDHPTGNSYSGPYRVAADVLV